jgi:hypothetical protein
MKALACLATFFALVLSAQGDNWLQNGDFSSGRDHWRGDGQTPSDMAPSNPFDKPDPLLSKGLIIPLKPHRWTKITQDFRTKASQLVLTMTYVFSPGLTFSSKDDDYKNIPHQIDNELYGSFDLKPTEWMVLFTDFGNGAKGAYYTMDAKTGSSEPQTVHMDVKDLSPLEDEVITIAFPPGTGNVVLQSVSLSEQ